MTLLALFTMFENWKRDSPFKEMLPAREDILIHPIRSLYMLKNAIVQSVNDNSAKVHQMRQDDINDIHKQNTYRKAHGIEDKQGIGPWMPAEEKLKLMEKQQSSSTEAEENGSYVDFERRKRPVKKWLGIW